MAWKTEKRTEAYGAPTPSKVRRAQEQLTRQYEKAARRRKIAEVAASVNLSIVETQRFIEQSMKAKTIPPGSLPSAGSIHAYRTAWLEGKREITDYMDAPRPGRPRTRMADALERAVELVIDSGAEFNAKKLTEELTEFAKRLKVEKPTYYRVHSRNARAGRLKRSAARHGSRAAEFDGFAHARFVTRHSHDTWALDELQIPVFLTEYDPYLGRWVTIRPEIVAIVDVCSTAVVGYHIADPSTRRHEDGTIYRTGFTADDVLAALLMASCPELATDATRAYSGYLPDRLRWDNASQHKALKETLELAGVRVDSIRKRRPISNAAVERKVGVLKPACAGMLGHVDDYLPTDVIPESSEVFSLERSMAVAKGERESRRLPILPEDLMTLAEFRVAFDRLVQEHNARLNRVHKMAPCHKYERDRDRRRARRGHDLVRVLPIRTTVVSTDGIVYQENGVTHQFHPLLEDCQLLLDSVVSFFADVVGRGIFVVREKTLHFLKAKKEWSDADAARNARNMTAVARLLSDHAQETRESALASQIGREAVEAAKVAHAQNLGDANKAHSRNIDEHSIEVFEVGTPVNSRPLEGPWHSDDPDAFLGAYNSSEGE